MMKLYYKEERVFVLFIFLKNMVVRTKICLKELLFVLFHVTGSRK